MQSRSIWRSGQPTCAIASRMRAFDRDLIRGRHYGQRSCEPHKQAEHMAAPTNLQTLRNALPTRSRPHMKRRECITLLGGAAAAWPLAALSEQTPKLRTIGFLGAANLSAWRPWVAALVQRLHELGWIEGRTIAIEYRWAEG